MNKLIGTTVGLAISIIVVASILVPTLNEATTTHETFTNEGLYYMTDLGDNSIVYTYDGSIWTINGEEADIDNTNVTTVIAGDGFIVRANGQFRGDAVISPASITTMTVTASGITGSYVNSGGNSATIAISAEVYYCAVNEETTTALTEYNSTTYLLGDSEIFADGLSAVVSGTYCVFAIEGNIDDGFTVTPQLSGVTVSDVTCNYEAVDGYNDLYKVTSITFNSIYNESTVAQTYTSYIAPTEVTAEKTVHFTDGENALLNVFPIMIIVGIVMAAIGLVVLRRD